MRVFFLPLLLMIAGCASLDSDLKSAQAACPQTSQLVPFIACLNRTETPVWQKDSPSDAPAFQAFAAARMDLAQNLDSGKITTVEYSRDMEAARQKFAQVLAGNARQRQVAEQRRRDQDAVDMLSRMPD